MDFVIIGLLFCLVIILIGIISLYKDLEQPWYIKILDALLILGGSVISLGLVDFIIHIKINGVW